MAPFALDPIEIKSYIAGMDFFMGSRMHSTIAAFSSEVPVVPMAYSRKFNGLFIDTLQYPYIIDLKSMPEVEIQDQFQKMFNDRNELKLIIRERLKGVVKMKKDIIISDLSDFLKK